MSPLPYTTYGGSTWTVGALPAGGTARIIFNLFVLDNAQTTFFTQVSAANEEDIDSTPDNNNGVCCTVEDAEEFININISPTTRLGASQKVPLAIENLFPNPAIDQIQMIILSEERQRTPALIYNNLGQIVVQISLNLEIGINTLSLDIAQLSPGMYYLYLPEGHSQKNTGRFVKENR